VERLNEGLAALSTKYDARFYTPSLAWYGVDPIHIRRRFWPLAWSQMLGADLLAMKTQKAFAVDLLRLRFLRPEQRWFFGREQFTEQSGYSLSSGIRIWLF